jgi:hypothetical protein
MQSPADELAQALHYCLGVAQNHSLPYETVLEHCRRKLLPFLSLPENRTPPREQTEIRVEGRGRIGRAGQETEEVAAS